MEHGQRQGRGDHRQAAPRARSARCGCSSTPNSPASPILRARPVPAGAAGDVEPQRRHASTRPTSCDRRPARRLRSTSARCAPTGARLSEPRARGNAPPWSRRTPMGLGRADRQALAARAARPSSSPACRGAQRSRAVCPSATIYVLDGLLPGAAGLREFGLRPVLTSAAEIATGPPTAGAPRRSCPPPSISTPAWPGSACRRRGRSLARAPTCSPPSSRRW